MKACEHRVNRDYSDKRLRRARRLYGYILSKTIPTGIDGVRIIKQLPKRLKERGFYSKATDSKSIEFSIYRHLYRNRTGCNDKRYRDEWFQWLMKNGYGRSPWYDSLPEKRRVRA